MVKKAYLRTLEVIIAIVLVIGFLILISQKQIKTSETPSTIKESRKFIFNEILSNDELRNIIISNNGKKCSELDETNKLIEFIKENTPINYVYECEICITQSSCTQLDLPLKNIYADSISISDETGQLTFFRLYFWEK